MGKGNDSTFSFLTLLDQFGHILINGAKMIKKMIFSFLSISSLISALTVDDINHYFLKKGWNVTPHYQEFSLPSDPNINSLEEYFIEKGWSLNGFEGHLSASQQSVFNQYLRAHPEITTILETGLNAGHSAENFFQNCKNLKKFFSFDDFSHDYGVLTVNFFKTKYGDRFEFVQGDSVITLRNYVKNNPQIKLDLVFIDGGHGFDTCCSDIINSQKISTPNTVVWIDDCGWGTVRDAVEYCVQQNIIKIDTIHLTNDRFWAEAHFVFN